MTSPTPTAHRLYAAVQDPKPQAVVIHCSDPRFQTAFEQFITDELHLAKGEYIPIVVGGGAGVLGHPEQLPKEFKFLKERLELYRTTFPTVRRVILINHENCHYYDSLKLKALAHLGQHLKAMLDEAHEDLSLVSRVFAQLLSHLGYTVELYYARFADAEHSKVVFEKAGG
ncbi:MAG: hypothetical protein NTW03_12845 [Verrucomicrobia bacterium]|nr:hypothetical protein [Verrucomicrobiota bacterium]